ncbi:MoaD/ThiS family protein [Nocardioides sp.]|uniref:MoaD/ThiS family protein n=1 Tax=Nocardioides sp. TaxID=35761 RepID=UPI003D113809
MDTSIDSSDYSETGVVTVHYWASARAAAGVDAERVAVTAPITLTELIDLLVARHPGTNLVDVLHACSVLRGDEPVKNRDPATVLLRAGQTVEFLPPFAGG